MKLFAVTTRYAKGMLVAHEMYTIHAVFAENKNEAKIKTEKSTGDNVCEIREINQSWPLEEILLTFGVGFIK